MASSFGTPDDFGGGALKDETTVRLTVGDAFRTNGSRGIGDLGVTVGELSAELLGLAINGGIPIQRNPPICIIASLSVELFEE